MQREIVDPFFHCFIRSEYKIKKFVLIRFEKELNFGRAAENFVGQLESAVNVNNYE